MEKDTILQSISQDRIISAELNLDVAGFFSPHSKRHKHFISKTFTSKKTDAEGNILKVKVIVEHSPTYGALTTYDQKLMYVLTELWWKQGKPEKVYFSMRELCENCKVAFGAPTISAIRSSLNRLALCSFIWEESYYKKESKGYEGFEEPFHILQQLKIATNKQSGFKIQNCYFSFHPATLKNLLSGHTRPLDLDVILSFKNDFAQLLYVFLTRRMYKTDTYSVNLNRLIQEELQLPSNDSKKKYRQVHLIKKATPELLQAPIYYPHATETFTNVEVVKEKRGENILRVQRTNTLH